MKKLIIFLIHLYQKIPFSSHNKCRFFPTCSNYSIDAISNYGVFKGMFLTIKRILRCNCFGSFGFDPVPIKEKKMKKTKKLSVFILIFFMSFFVTGCSNDSMNDIDIIVTNYPNEFIVKNIYANHATISSIYPDGVDINNYKITNKQKKEYSKKDLFIYNGLIDKERKLALDLLAINPNLKIIDTAYVLETEYSPEELWLNPASFLMMGQNVRHGLEEYATSTYLKKDINDAYEELKIKLSLLDAEYRLASESTDNKNIVVSDDVLNYLEKFGLNVYCVDDEASQKVLSDVENMINENKISYILKFKNDSLNDTANNILTSHDNVKLLELNKVDILSDSDRRDMKDYISLMEDNLELIKKELYQ